MVWLEFLAAAATAIGADQVLKARVLAAPRLAPAPSRWGYVSIRCTINRRIALVSLSDSGIAMVWVLCAALSCFALGQEPLADNALGATGLGLALGGITGNVIDILRRRGVVDFIALGSWTIFNLADVAILGGLALAAASLV